MNIMIVDYDRELCAQAHPQQHVGKLILEAAQMMGTAHRMAAGTLQKVHYITSKGTPSKNKKSVYVLPGDVIESIDGKDTITSVDNGIYLNGYEKHPCTQWVCESLSNYQWLYGLCYELNRECLYRGASKDHLSWQKMQKWDSPSIEDIGLTTFPRAFSADMKDECMAIEDTVQAYRHYYMFGKTHLLKYKKRKPPYWMPQDIWKYNEQKDLYEIV